jgi:hypothetical protein
MFRRTFTSWGLPNAVRVDNGYPWGTPRDLPTELALWLIGLGLEVIWNPPAQPRSNPKVERCQGVADAWTEPQSCTSPDELSDRLDWACRTQCREYPSVAGLSRIAAYPQLLVPRRGYQESQESGIWKLDRVDRWLSQQMWSRRVGKSGVISMYGHRRSLGRAYRGQEVQVHFDSETRRWVVADETGQDLAQFLAWELTRESILSLAVGRKRSK